MGKTKRLALYARTSSKTNILGTAVRSPESRALEEEDRWWSAALRPQPTEQAARPTETARALPRETGRSRGSRSPRRGPRRPSRPPTAAELHRSDCAREAVTAHMNAAEAHMRAAELWRHQRDQLENGLVDGLTPEAEAQHEPLLTQQELEVADKARQAERARVLAAEQAKQAAELQRRAAAWLQKERHRVFDEMEMHRMKLAELQSEGEELAKEEQNLLLGMTANYWVRVRSRNSCQNAVPAHSTAPAGVLGPSGLAHGGLAPGGLASVGAGHTAPPWPEPELAVAELAAAAPGGQWQEGGVGRLVF
jgi:hypothetical protein